MAFPATVACVCLHALASIRRKPCTCVYHRRGRCPHRPVQALPNLYHFKGAYSGRLIASPTFLTSFPPYRSTLQHLKLDVLCRLSSKCLPHQREPWVRTGASRMRTLQKGRARRGTALPLGVFTLRRRSWHCRYRRTGPCRGEPACLWCSRRRSSLRCSGGFR